MSFFYTCVPSLGDKFHGLLNQGATCYLNSVLQVLYMTEDFKEAVEGHCCKNPDTECIDLQLSSLFDELKQRTAYTYKITKKLSIDKVYEQRDAAEYFEKILGLTSSDASQIFHGELTHKTTCSTCKIDTDAAGAFWNLPLALVNSYCEKYSVVNGIKEYFTDLKFSGENQMYCDVCDAKSDATITCVIKHHPEVLMLLLKRFEFDYSYMTYVKINCPVEVPRTLQIPENQTYELYAVVDHFGDLRSGHYTATIKSEGDEKWYNFNDDRVTLLDYQPFQVDNSVESGSAYLLFYRKKTVPAADTCTQDIREASTPRGSSLATSDTHDQCQDVIMEMETEEVEGSAGAGYDTAVVVSIDRSVETGIKDFVSVDDQNKKRELFCSETELEQSVDDEVNDRARPEVVRDRRSQEGLEGDDTHNTSYNYQKYKQEVDNMYSQQVCVDMQKEEESRAVDVNRDKDGKVEGDEQLGRRGIAPTKYLKRDAEHHDDEGLHDVRQDMYEEQKGKQEVGQDYDLKPFTEDRQGYRERIEIDDKVDKERKLGDLYFQDERRVVDSKQNIPKDDHRIKLLTISSRFDQSHEQQREESDVKGDKQQKRGDDKHVQRKGTSERQDFGQDREDQNNGRSDDVRQNRSERDDEHIQRRADSSLKRGGSAGSRRQGDSQAKPGARCNEDTMEGRCGSTQSKIKLHGKIIEEEFRQTNSGVQRSSETKNIRIETVEGTSQAGRSWVEYERETDAKVTLSEGVGNLKLSDSLSPKQAGSRGMSQAQEQVVGTKFEVKKRGKDKRKLQRQSSPLKQNKSKKKKRNKTTSCFSFFKKSRKNVEQASDTE
ncbi:uncharacterized protein LOC115023417 [Cottoperca gobio]|uniref:Ubiquitin carboxyl-terminal hydrolase n=1 Tax=Cottoperca gobio TaxID=56716 RepID=A0A6J2RJ67_COTGO|nr:uncharacterized protein LOC115023417 [Cottoperca gobio]